MGEGGEVEVCADGCVNVPIESGSPVQDKLKRHHDCVDGGVELYVSPVKKQALDLPSDKADCSEVSNPTLCPHVNACGIQGSASLTMVLPVDGSLVRCSASEVTSKCSDLSPKESLSNEESSGSGNSAEFDGRSEGNESGAKARVVLEIPKHVSTTGIRKITFKLSKRKEDRDDENSSFVHRPDFSHSASGAADGYIKVEQDGVIPERARSLHSLCTPNLELKMSKKVFPSSYPTNVKKLLLTGILDGARIKYTSSSKDQRHLDGVIKAGGYLCGCSLCNYSKVLSAFEFEQHAGFKSKHPNNRIFLENGKPVYSIIQELKNAPKGILDVVLKDVAGSAINEDSFLAWKESLVHGSGRVEVEKPYSNIYHQSQRIEESDRATENYAKDHFRRPAMLTDEYKPVVKMPGMFNSYSQLLKKTAESSKRSRDNDLHKLLFMPNGLPDGAELAYFIKGQRILGGYKQGNGIVCNCCQKEISPSQFEAHAGMAVRRQPYRHIYASNGLNLHDISLSLANGHNLAGSSDDMCSSCGEEGNLILCVQCPRAFHAACLGLDSVPEGDWYCTNCMDKSLPGKKAISGDINGGRQIFIRLTRVVKEPEYDIGGCCVCRDHDFSTGTFDERTVIICDQCEKEFHVGCLRKNGQCDLRELPSDKWFCCADCHRIHKALERSVSSGFETVPCSLLNIISRKHVEKGLLFGGCGNDVQWRILSGKSRFPEHLPLLSRATAIFRECFDPIVAASGRDLIPVMVYGRNISGQEFGGMYCVVLTVKSVVVSAGLLRIFGKEVAELPMVATCGEFQGKGYFQTLFTCIEGLLYSLNVEKLVVSAAEEAESIWTKRFGFRRMSEEKLVKHMKDHQLTIFKGTSMLEKEVAVNDK